MKEYFKIVCAVHLFLIKDGKILMLRRFNTGYEDGSYSVIAGHIDGDEQVRDAMVREAKEEAGISIEKNDLRFVHVMHRKSSEERVDFFFVCDRWNGEAHNAEPTKCDDLRWFSLDSLPKNMVPYVRQGIDRFKENILFSEHGWQ
ncbi:MAG: NUDIX domain-containing protein [Candidatus Aenigmarchaeota archaeon]|nr:NUDIX domain-containing protein [Candidatus Aenigmarchaeota archaeon]